MKVFCYMYLNIFCLLFIKGHKFLVIVFFRKHTFKKNGLHIANFCRVCLLFVRSQRIYSMYKVHS